jgi:hypothetical protein
MSKSHRNLTKLLLLGSRLGNDEFDPIFMRMGLTFLMRILLLFLGFGVGLRLEGIRRLGFRIVFLELVVILKRLMFF